MTEQQNADEDRDINVISSIDGATTLAEASMLAHGFAAELRRLHDEGYLLREPVADGTAVAYKPTGENQNIIGDHAHLHPHDESHEPVEPAEEPNRGFVQF